jgi:PAS domain S-box-containing protein
LEGLVQGFSGLSALGTNNEIYANYWAYGRDAMLVVDLRTGQLVDANPASEELSGYDRQELISMRLDELYPIDLITLGKSISSQGDLSAASCNHASFERKNGERVPIVFSSSEQFLLAGRSLKLCTFREMSDLEKQRHSLATLQWALSAYAGVALALAHADSSQGLLQAICEAIVQESAYVLAWVGVAEDLPEKPVRILAAAGKAKEQLSEMKVSWAEERENGNGAVGVAIRTAEVNIISDVEASPRFAPWREWALRQGIHSLVGIPLSVEGNWRGALVVYAGRVNAFEPGAIEVFENLAKEISHGLHALHQKELLEAEYSERIRAQEKLAEALTSMVSAMVSAVETRDPYTAGHENRVGEIAYAIGKEMGWDEDRLIGLKMAAMVHDFGKISVPTKILNKPGSLDAAEWVEMRKHPETGYEILKDIPFTWPVADIMRQHHEKMDGSGYPLGLTGEHILPEAKVLAVADMLEAMTSDRPYRLGTELHIALGAIEKESGSKLDPEVVRVCLKLFREQGFQLPGML